MDDVSKDVIAILTQLLPGFLTAWVAYGLTNYAKPSQFERVVQALIYSFIVGVIVVIIERGALLVGRRWVVLGAWDKDAGVIASALVAVVLGLVIATCSTNDEFFALLRRMRITTRTPFPSEWYGRKLP